MVNSSINDIGFVLMLIVVVSYYTILAYTMVDYVTEINKIPQCSALASTEGNIIQAYGSVNLVVWGMLFLMMIGTMLHNLIR